MFRLLVAVLTLVSTPTLVHAQWTKVADNILGTRAPVGNAGGIIKYEHNRVWAGDHALWFSDDLGLTWEQSPLPIDPLDRVTDLSFFDARHGAVCTFGSDVYRHKVYLTSDGGTTWQASDSNRYGGYGAVTYGATVNELISSSSVTHVSHDGGATWTQGPPTELFLVRQGNKLLTLVRDVSLTRTCHLSQSTDGGAYWSQAGGTIPEDSYSLAIDSCDPNFYVLTNENWFWNDPPISNVFITTNAGSSWRLALSGTQATNRLTGAVARGKRAIYCTTLWDGVLQSVDYGQTWKALGGPSGTPDSRDVCCITDNIILVCDVNGSIWRTTNGGGSIVHVADSTSFTPSQPFDNLSLSVCDSTYKKTIYLNSAACERREITSSELVGPDTAYFHLLRGLPQYPSGFDSIQISFHADTARTYRATYLIHRGSQVDSLVLIGHGHDPIRSISAVSGKLAFDTIRACQSSTRSIWIRSYSCLPWRVKNARILGPDSALFAIARPTPFVLAGLDSLDISFAPDRSGGFRDTLRLLLDDGTTLDIPVEGASTQVPAAIVLSQPTLFDTVRRSFCESSVESLWIDDTACTRHSLLSCRIIGSDSSYYSLVRTGPLSLPDSIVVLFTPDTTREYKAALELVFSDSTKVTVPLLGSGKRATHVFAMPDLSRLSDSLGLCDEPIEHWIILHDTACSWASLLSLSLSDTSHFSLVTFRHSGASADSVLIRCSGDSTGTYFTTLTLKYSDTTITIPLTLYGKTIDRSLHVSRSALFVGDTASACAAGIIRNVILTDSSCLPWYVIGYRWSGADSVYYSIAKALPSPLTGSDTLGLLFLPDAPRHFNAGLTVVLSDGREVAIDLQGDGAPYAEISLSTADVSTVAVGDVVHIPIYLTHTGPVPSVRFAVQYDTSLLRFVTAHNGAGASVASGDVMSGRFAVTLDSSDIQSNGLVGELDFAVFPTSDSCGLVRLDSLRFESNSLRVCAVVTLDSAVSRVCGPYDCTVPIFSDFLRYSRLPRITVAPNPVETELRVTTDLDLGLSRLTLYSALGEKVTQRVTSLSQDSPVSLSLESLPAGVYYLSITSASGYKKSVRIVRER